MRQDDLLIFTGRPNAGKSSVISAITGLKLDVGKRPGTTTSFDKYRMAKGLILVDMPGYGVKAGASKRWEDRVKDQILDFVQENAGRIILTVHVINISTFIEVERRLAKKGFISLDVEMVRFLRDTLEHHPLVATNKIDKINKEGLSKNLLTFMNRLSGNRPELVEDYIFPVSAKTGEGMGDLKNAIHQILVEKGHLRPFDYV
jgi:GTP-binding protein EngB required for normal cell division